MSSKFIQGAGYPVLTRYNSSNTLQETVNLPYVRDDGKSYIRQYFIPYPDDKYTKHELLSGNISEDKPLGYKLQVKIKYNQIESATLLSVYTCILTALKNSGDYLKLKPRHDHTVDSKVVFKGNIDIESTNAWRHNVDLEFNGTELLANTLTLAIPT